MLGSLSISPIQARPGTGEYTTLERLVSKGLARRAYQGRLPGPNGYSITDEGRAFLKENPDCS